MDRRADNARMARLAGFVRGMHALRAWTRDEAPMADSQVAQDLLLLVAHGTLEGRPPTLKELTASLVHSEAGLRKQLGLCREQGWIRMSVHPQDRRVRVLCAGQKLLDHIADYHAQTVEHLLPALLGDAHEKAPDKARKRVRSAGKGVRS